MNQPYPDPQQPSHGGPPQPWGAGTDEQTARIPQYGPASQAPPWAPPAAPRKKRRWPWVVGGLDYTSFSRSGLIDQLEFEGYTSEQAEHGANSVGL